jgi:hypothetical protein
MIENKNIEEIEDKDLEDQEKDQDQEIEVDNIIKEEEKEAILKIEKEIEEKKIELLLGCSKLDSNSKHIQSTFKIYSNNFNLSKYLIFNSMSNISKF